MPLFCTFPLSPLHFQHGHQERSHHPDDAAGAPVTHAHPSPAGSIPIEPLADRSHHHPNAETGHSASRHGAGEGGGSHGERRLTPHSRQRGRRAGQSPLPTPRPAPAPRGQTKPLPLQRRFLHAQQVPVTGLSPPLRAEETAPRGAANALKTPWELVMGGVSDRNGGDLGQVSRTAPRARGAPGFPPALPVPPAPVPSRKATQQRPASAPHPAGDPRGARAPGRPGTQPAAASTDALRDVAQGCGRRGGRSREQLLRRPAAMPGERWATGGKTSAR